DIGPKRAVAFDNMRSQKVNGTKDWKRYTIELDIPADADTVRFGALMSGHGEAWFDSLAIAIDGKPWQRKDLDLALEDPAGPIGMTRKPSHPRFSIAMDETGAKSGQRSLHLTGTPAFEGQDPGFVSATGTLPVGDFAGRDVRYSGWIRTEDVSNFAGLWMRADTPDRRSTAFDNMQSQQLEGTREWSHYEIKLTIPDDTNNVNFGVLLSGQGKAWFDGLTIEVDGKPWQSHDIELDLEHPSGPIGLGRFDKHPRFTMSMDEDIASQGTRSLRLTGGPPVSDPTQERALAATRKLVDELEVSRAELARSSSPEEAGWAIHNAHVFMQSQLKRLNASATLRDSCMAANLEWTAEEARKGSKIVIWAHNGHIEKQEGRMGGWLAKRYGRDYVAIGFATNEGTYTALPQTGDRLSSKNVLVPGPRGSIEAAAKATALPRFLLDLRLSRETPEIERLLRSPILMRSIGAMAMTHQFFATSILDRFDALAWVERTESSHVFGITTAQVKR
ncbi:MAG TPA: erythromycin esterase family protein, partial [Candidatus Eisenbacteria bacterium]|nr:erythromycin esterase family protein [Candidatus Eisenbacteria bacterium]